MPIPRYVRASLALAEHFLSSERHTLVSPSTSLKITLRTSVAHLVGVPRIHGGSFYYGSATYGGLDGSSLALTSGAVVAVVQYRLGVLGFLPPVGASGGVNLGVQDITQALQFIRKNSFGHGLGVVTVAGQSSGAAMIRGQFLRQCTGESRLT